MERIQNTFLEQELDPKVLSILRSLVLILLFLVRCGEHSEHFFGTRIGPKRVLSLQKLSTDLFLIGCGEDSEQFLERK